MILNTKKILVDRLKEVLLDGTWIAGTNFKTQISELDWQVAAKSVSSLNSIADITFHVHYYIAGVIQVLEGGPLEIKDKYSFQYPGIKSNEDWKVLVAKFCVDSEKLINLVTAMSNEKLFADFVAPKYGNYYRNINVIIEHTYYHLGQVLLIKKISSTT